MKGFNRDVCLRVWDLNNNAHTPFFLLQLVPTFISRVSTNFRSRAEAWRILESQPRQSLPVLADGRPKAAAHLCRVGAFPPPTVTKRTDPSAPTLGYICSAALLQFSEDFQPRRVHWRKNKSRVNKAKQRSRDFWPRCLFWTVVVRGGCSTHGCSFSSGGEEWNLSINVSLGQVEEEDGSQ